MFEKEEKKVKNISSLVRNRKKSDIEKSHLIIDRVLTNHFYKDVANFHEADRNFTVNNKCISCGLCVKRCPVNNITINEGKPVWNHKCELCLACIQSCSSEAINYAGKTEKRKRYLNPNVKL